MKSEGFASREDVIAEAIAAARSCGGAVLVVCQSDPRCPLVGDEATAAQEAGCPWCERITVGPNGDVSVAGPGSA